LAKAEDRIRELQKEADLLKATLEQAKAARPDDAAVAAEQKRLAELKQQLTEQGDVVQRLQKENDKLREENTNLREQASRRTEPAAPQNVTEITEELAVARATVSALQATNTALRAEMLLLEKQLLGSVTAPTAAPTTAPTANEQLANTLKKLETELEVARARLEVYESKPVPYTVEELALFKQPDARMAISQQTNMVPATTNLASRRVLQPPPGSGPLFNEAIRAAEAGRMDEAEQKLEQVLRQDEKNTYTLTRLAAVEIDLKKWDEADGHLQTAQAVDPQEPGVLMVLGQLRYFQERYDEALDTLSRCAVVMPNEPRVYFFLGKTLVQKGNRQQAEKALRKVVQLRPGWGEGHYTLAVLYASQDPPFKELAQWHYEKALRAGVPANPTFERLVHGTETTASAPK
jgi:tetratricopeptide (TPR) repeat protein